MAKKVQFSFNGEKWEAYWNGKEYKGGMVYGSFHKVGSSSADKKFSFSRERETFVDYSANYLDEAKSAARALDIIE